MTKLVLLMIFFNCISNSYTNYFDTDIYMLDIPSALTPIKTSKLTPELTPESDIDSNDSQIDSYEICEPLPITIPKSPRIRGLVFFMKTSEPPIDSKSDLTPPIEALITIPKSPSDDDDDEKFALIRNKDLIYGNDSYLRKIFTIKIFCAIYSIIFLIISILILIPNFYKK